MTRPKLLLTLSEIWTMADPRDLRAVVDLAVDAEEAGFDAIMLSEHIVLGPSSDRQGLPLNPREFVAPGNQEPTHPWPSSLIQLAAIAARTSRIELIAGALLTPLRHPLLVANELATLDLLSAGRLTVLPTVSWHEDEYAALGVPFSQRGRILDEQLEIFQLVWSQSPAGFEGRYFSFGDVYLEPKPHRPGGPKFWFGGSSVHDAVIRRIARYGTGYLPMGRRSRADWDRLAAAMAAAGRDMSELERVSGLTAPFTSPDGCISLDAALEAAAARIEAGATAFIVKPSQFVDDPAEVRGLCERIVDSMAALECA
jgi:probable F420-dependent oxidoreductase